MVLVAVLLRDLRDKVVWVGVLVREVLLRRDEDCCAITVATPRRADRREEAYMSRGMEMLGRFWKIIVFEEE